MPLYIDSIKLEGKPRENKLFTLLKEMSKPFTLQPSRCLSAKDNFLYISQREYGSVRNHDENIRYIGSGDATTCQIIVLISDHAISVGHFDGSDTEGGIVDMLKQHTKLDGHGKGDKSIIEKDLVIQAHIFGGFEDDRELSIKLLDEILIILSECPFRIHLMTACVHSVNTKILNGNPVPIIYGIACDVISLKIFPAKFQNKGPCSLLRNARIYGGSKETTGIFNGIDRTLNIGPYSYNVFEAAYIIPRLSDSDILKYCSTSPHCEPEDFAETTRKSLQFLTENPDTSLLFPDQKPLRYTLKEDGHWKKFDS